ncbi:MAG: DCC1-like thiol-disulfide oxidoreductase family protein [Candidatus Sulfotelmatobacter sp.]|jgi:predicted DCC family thiol-disulfide oxidoreductase YuxK
MAELPRPILLYDGVCGLCHRLVQFIIHRDRRAIFRFASLQSPLAAGILGRHGANPTGLDTVYAVLNHELPTESLLSRSDAVIFVLKQLPVPWPAAAFLLGLLPGFIRDLAYDVVARQRYRLFGRSEICMLPSDQDHSRFLDV